MRDDTPQDRALRRARYIRAAGAIALAVVPVLGLWLWEWDARNLLFLYWFEILALAIGSTALNTRFWAMMSRTEPEWNVVGETAAATAFNWIGAPGLCLLCLAQTLQHHQVNSDIEAKLIEGFTQDPSLAVAVAINTFAIVLAYGIQYFRVKPEHRYRHWQWTQIHVFAKWCGFFILFFIAIWLSGKKYGTAPAIVVLLLKSGIGVAWVLWSVRASKADDPMPVRQRAP